MAEVTLNWESLHVFVYQRVPLKMKTLLSNENFDLYVSTKLKTLLSKENFHMYLSTKLKTSRSNENVDIYLSIPDATNIGVYKSFLLFTGEVRSWHVESYVPV